jgi:hypothetical protein
MPLATGGALLSHRPAGTANFRGEGPAHKLYRVYAAFWGVRLRSLAAGGSCHVTPPQ